MKHWDLVSKKIETAWFSHTSSVHTMKDWPRRIDNIDELPECFSSLSEKIKIHSSGCVYIPAITQGKWKRVGRLVILNEDNIEMYTDANPVSKQCIPLKAIAVFEMGCVLLSAWIVLHWENQQVRLEFNTVMMDLFTPLLAAWRSATHNSEEPNIELETQNKTYFDALASTNYKFMNLGRHVASGWAPLNRVIYEPKRETEPATFLKMRLWRRYATPVMFVCSDRECIRIREPQHESIQQTNHGSIMEFIATDKITGVLQHPVNDHITRTVLVINDGLRIETEHNTRHSEMQYLASVYPASTSHS